MSKDESYWTSFWKSSGSLNSFIDGPFSNNYDDSLGAFWSSIASKLGEGDLAVDLCCGNGAVAYLLRKNISDRTRLKLIGVDFSSIDPVSNVENTAVKEVLQKIRFIPNTNIEELPFYSNSVSMFVSQYGFEYSKTEISLHEIHRTLVKNGEAHFICHCDGSVYFEQAIRRAKLLSLMASRNGLVTKIVNFLQSNKQFIQENKITNVIDIQRFSSEFVDIQNHCVKIVNDKGFTIDDRSFLDTLISLMLSINFHNFKKTFQKISSIETSLREELMRCEALIGASLTKDKKLKLKDVSERLSMEVRYTPFEYKGHLIGCYLTILKK